MAVGPRVELGDECVRERRDGLGGDQPLAPPGVDRGKQLRSRLRGMAGLAQQIDEAAAFILGPRRLGRLDGRGDHTALV